ncbi:MAG: SURF1 family protein [Acidimicrobiales bacterium]|nr:SURF1 family protein [Acidimicrobiales bacterium]
MPCWAFDCPLTIAAETLMSDARRLLRPWWIASHVVVTALLVLTINLGFWQLRRLDTRQDYNATVTTRNNEPVVPLAEALIALAAGRPIDDLRYVQVWVEGTWDLDREVLLVNRSQDGVPGVHVLSFLHVDDIAPASGLVVDRGFVPRPLQLVGDPNAWAPVSRAALLRGSLDVFQSGERSYEREVDRIDRTALEARWDVGLAPMWLRVAESTGRDTWPAPTPIVGLGDGRHLSYAVQWFIFTLVGVVGYPLVLIRVHRSSDSRSGGGPNPSIPEWDAPVA